MAISLIVEDGSIVAGSNTYANATYVDTYCTNMGYDDWQSGGSDKSKSAILRAMSYIDSKNFCGIKSSSNQELEFPRIGLLDSSGYQISSSEIPEDLKKALAEGARREYVESGILQQDFAKGGKIKRKKTDVLETEYFNSAPAGTTITIIDNYLKAFVGTSGILTVRL